MSRLLTDLPLEEQIDRLPAEPNWDGAGAEAVSPEVRAEAKTCLRLLGALRAAPEVGPTPDGGIAFVWQTQPNREIEARFESHEYRLVVLDLGAHKILQRQAFTDATELVGILRPLLLR